MSGTAIGNTAPATAFDQARAAAEDVAKSVEFTRFRERLRSRFPQQVRTAAAAFDRDYVRVVDHHLRSLTPKLQSYVDSKTRRVLDFGCGSGGSAIALAMVYPDVVCYGTDVDREEIDIAKERAQLYGVGERCDFRFVPPNQHLPFEGEFFDLCQCSSVLEYVVDSAARRFCVREMVRLIRVDGLLFVSVPNRLYPFEIHSWWRGSPNWGWNYFPKLLKAHTVDCTVWEVQRMARPTSLKLYRTPLRQLFRPWSTFCLRKESYGE
jgi:SAM-dependent methyltransferase